MEMSDVNTQNVNELLTVIDVMSRLKVGRSRVYSLINSGKLRAVKVGHSRRIFSRDLDAYLESLLSETDPTAE